MRIDRSIFFKPQRKTGILMLVSALLFTFPLFSAEAPTGFQNAGWGMGPQEVATAAGVENWQQKPPEGDFPAGVDITTYVSDQTIAGYEAQVSYYFFEQQFFQAT
ncbi:MAG: hypothetical protein ACOCW2_01725, partial [Chitinivibrionales bacterium]